MRIFMCCSQLERMKNKNEKILELEAEGGSITLFKTYDKNDDEWYFHKTNEMSYDDLRINGTDKNSKFSMSFPEALLTALIEYPNLLDLFPLFVNEDYKSVIIEFLRQKKNELQNLNNWEDILQIENV